jgi:drug/metabolite transporter (DMT)-like permease
MQLNTVGRVVGCLGILAIEAWRGKLSRHQDGISLLDPRGWAVAFVSAAQTGMYIAVHFLASSGNVSVLLALASLYNIVPPIYGLVRGGELVTWPKLAGFFAAALAVALLSAASATSGGGEASESESSNSPLLQAVLVLVAIIGWGATDTIFSRIGKSLPSTTTAMWYAIGNATFSIVLSQMASASRQVTHSALAVTATPTATSSSETASIYGYFALFGTNIIAMAGWYGFITLGRVADASTFVPIVAAILTVTPSIIGTALLGETFSGLMGAGVGCAVVSAVCMSLQPSAASPSARASDSFDEDPRAKEIANSYPEMTASASLVSLANALAPQPVEAFGVSADEVKV